MTYCRQPPCHARTRSASMLANNGRGRLLSVTTGYGCARSHKLKAVQRQIGNVKRTSPTHDSFPTTIKYNHSWYNLTHHHMASRPGASISSTAGPGHDQPRHDQRVPTVIPSETECAH